MTPFLCCFCVCFPVLFMVDSKDRARYQNGPSANFIGFMLATSMHALSFLNFIFIAISHKHYALTATPVGT